MIMPTMQEAGLAQDGFGEKRMPIGKNRIAAICRVATLFLALATLLCGPASAGESMDLGKAIRIGIGKTMVIEFTDPDCPFCRKAAAYFRDRRDVTLYVFLKPLAMHTHAREKAQYILSAADRAKAYEEVMAGKLDGRQSTGITQAGMQLLEEHMAVARKERIDNVPTFIIAGRIITGFNQQQIEALLPR
jgi:thiol:disulfide interchange protein DsbC